MLCTGSVWPEEPISRWRGAVYRLQHTKEGTRGMRDSRAAGRVPDRTLPAGRGENRPARPSPAPLGATLKPGPSAARQSDKPPGGTCYEATDRRPGRRARKTYGICLTWLPPSDHPISQAPRKIVERFLERFMGQAGFDYQSIYFLSLT